MTGKQPAALAATGWTTFAHPLFIEQISTLTLEVASLKKNGNKRFFKKCCQATGRDF
jgi:hypothetical protein